MVNREHVTSAVLATIFTLLIWLWAEDENREVRTVVGNLTVVGAGDDEEFRGRFNTGRGFTQRQLPIRVEIEGPNHLLPRAETRLNDLRLEVPDPENGEERVIELAGAIQALREVRSLGVNVVAVDPPQARVQMQEQVVVPVPLRPEFSGIDVEEMTVEPSAVEVTMTRDTWDWARAAFGEDLFTFTVAPPQLERLTPGETATLPAVPVQLRPELQSRGVSIVGDPVVRITLRPRLVIDEITLPVPVKIQMLPPEQLQYDVHVEPEHQLLQGVRVTGDAELIERLRRRDLKIHAVLDLTPDELEMGIESKEVEVPLPPGLTVSFPDLPPGERPEIPIEIRRRPPAEREADTPSPGV